MTRAQTLVAVFIFAIEVTATVVGQLLVKHAMEGSNKIGFTHPRTLRLFATGVLSLALSFFLTIGLLQHFDLSFFYPIQGSTLVIITLTAAIFLREKLTLQLLIGSLLI